MIHEDLDCLGSVEMFRVIVQREGKLAISTGSFYNSTSEALNVWNVSNSVSVRCVLNFIARKYLIIMVEMCVYVLYSMSYA